MSDKIINFYEKLNIGKGNKLTKNFAKHHILHNSMILAIGGTGTGKTNALLNYISRSNGEFSDVIICSFNTTDEPLYNLLEENGATLYRDIDEVPELIEYDDDEKNHPKLIVFDDFINIENKKLKKIYNYLISGRKFGFTCWLMSQNYSSVPKVIVRNINYFIMFKLNDNISLNNIIRNHNISDVDPSIIKSALNLCTQTPPNFFMIDIKTIRKKERFRKNFLEFLDLENLP